MTGQDLIDLIKRYGLETFDMGVVLEDVEGNVAYDTPFDGEFIKIADDGRAWISAKHEE